MRKLQRDADAAMQDGASGGHVCKLQQFGAGGKAKRNLERDLHRRVLKHMDVKMGAYFVNIQHLNKPKNLFPMCHGAVVVLHETWYCL